MPAELTDQKQLSTVINYLRDTNATEELLLDEVLSHKDVLASSDAKKYVRDAPILLEFIGEVMSDILLLTKDSVENGLKLIQNQREDAEEKRLEEKNNKKSDKASSGVTFADAKAAAGNNPLMLLLGAGAFLIGSIVGAVEQLGIFIKSALGETRLGKAVGEFVKTISGKISSVIDFGKDIVGKITDVVKDTFGKLFSKVKESFSFLGKISDFIKGIFSPAIKEISEFIGKGFKFFTGEGGGGLMDDFKKLFSKISFFFDIGKSFGKAVTKLLGKLALPLTIIMGIWDTVIGAIDGYKEGGIEGAFKGGITGLLNSVIGSLLDLVKDGVSWLLGALGFENAEKFLDSFSFSDLISKMVNAIFEIFSAEKFSKAFEKFNVVGVLGVLLGGILDTVKGAISWIFKMFGADKISEMLDSFSFQDLYDKLFTAIKDMAGDLASSAVDMIKSIAYWFKNLPDTITTMAIDFNQVANDFIKTILQNVLPRKDANSSWYSPMNLAAAAIPASVYEYAGMNPDTGEVIAKPNANEEALQKITSIPSDTASAVSSNPVATAAPTIINNVSRGGDVHNVSNSNVNQNVNGAAGPIVTGSAMGLYSF
jgi:gas vesicle protein